MIYSEVPIATVPNDDFKFRSPEPPPRPPKKFWQTSWFSSLCWVLLGALLGSAVSVVVVNRTLALSTSPLGTNPWAPQYSSQRGVVVAGGHKRLYLSGQLPLAASGNLFYPGNIRGQMVVALDNVVKALKAGGMSTSNVVKVTIYTVDINQVVTNFGVYSQYMQQPGGISPPVTYVGVKSLYNGALVQFDVEAVQ